MPPRGTKKQAANQQNPRHQNGLAQPGKRIEKESRLTKNKNNGHVNGNFKPTVSSPPRTHSESSDWSASESKTEEDGAEKSGPSLQGGGRRVSGLGGARGGTVAAGATEGRRASASSDANADMASTSASVGSGVAAEDSESYRKIDVAAFKEGGYVAKARGSVEAMSPIIKAFPLADSIAVLIVLISMAPVLFSITSLLFSFLTFIPSYLPSTSGLPSISSILAGSVGGPSLATVMISDLFVFVGWLFLWSPLQHVMISFAQAVIAVYLGSGHNGRRSTTRSALACTGIVLLCHAADAKGLKLASFEYLQFSLLSLAPRLSTGISRQDLRLSKLQNFVSWTQTVLALHVTAQGLLRSIRSWLVARTKASQPITSKKNDSDSGSTSLNQNEAKPSPDPSKSTSSHPAFDAQSSSPAPFKVGKDKASSSKKRRRRGQQIRSEQPVWAAIATLYAMLKNVLTQFKSSITAKAAGARDSGHLGSASFEKEGHSVWLSNVGATTIQFTAMLVASEGKIDSFEDEHDLQASSIAGSPPISVRVNGTPWPSVNIQPGARCCSEKREVREERREGYKAQDHVLHHAETAEDKLESRSKGKTKVDSNGSSKEASSRALNDSKVPDERDGHSSTESPSQWQGEIYGLAAGSSYHCEFVQLQDEKVMYTANITTLQSPSTAPAQSHPIPPPTQKPLRPSSPTTTLKESIAAAESTLNEARNHQKRNRKEQRAATNSLKRDVDSLSSKLSSSGANDERQRQRILQLKQSVRQSNEAYDQANEELERLGSIPEEDHEEWKITHQQWEDAQMAISNAEEELQKEKTNGEQQVAAANAEVASLTQKHERLLGRIQKLNEHHQRLSDLHVQGSNLKDQRAAEQQILSQQRKSTEQAYITELTTLQGALRQTTLTSQQMWQQINQIENTIRGEQQQHLVQQQQQSMSMSGRGPFDNTIPKSYPEPTSPLLGDSATFNPPLQPFGPPSRNLVAQGVLPSGPYSHDRTRSGSLLSGESSPVEAFVAESPFANRPGKLAQQTTTQYSGESSPTSSSGEAGREATTSPVVKLGSPLSTGLKPSRA